MKYATYHLLGEPETTIDIYEGRQQKLTNDTWNSGVGSDEFPFGAYKASL